LCRILGTELNSIPGTIPGTVYLIAGRLAVGWPQAGVAEGEGNVLKLHKTDAKMGNLDVVQMQGRAM